jgi:hypothetical protein
VDRVASDPSSAIECEEGDDIRGVGRLADPLERCMATTCSRPGSAVPNLDMSVSIWGDGLDADAPLTESRHSLVLPPQKPNDSGRPLIASALLSSGERSPKFPD